MATSKSAKSAGRAALATRASAQQAASAQAPIASRKGVARLVKPAKSAKPATNGKGNGKGNGKQAPAKKAKASGQQAPRRSGQFDGMKIRTTPGDTSSRGNALRIFEAISKCRTVAECLAKTYKRGDGSVRNVVGVDLAYQQAHGNIEIF